MNRFQIKILLKVFPVIIFFLFSSKLFSQNAAQTDSLIHELMNENHLTDNKDAGVILIKDKKFEEATSLFTSEINKDAGNKEAYFNRGVVNWATSNPANACRDWSSLLALGDTSFWE